MLDVDRLKLVNDDHGHQAGDAPPPGRGRRAVREGTQRRPGRSPGRRGVLVICPEIDAEAAALVAEKLVAAVDRLQLAELPTIAVSVSAGWSSAVGNTDTTQLLRAADQGMYAAKFRGRD